MCCARSHPVTRLTARRAPRYHNAMRTHSQSWHVFWRAASRLATAYLVLSGAPVLAQSGPDAGLSVVVTLQPWASLAEAVGGEHVDVVTLLPPGASPHSFDPSPSAAVALARADVIIMNGGLDDWLLRLLDATASDARRITMLDTVDLDVLSTDASHDEAGSHGPDHDGGHDHSGVNSHVWLDPVAAVRAVHAVAEEFSALDPAHREAFVANAGHVEARLLDLDEELRSVLRPFAGAGIVQFHDAWSHFAQRYGLEIIATLEPFPGREPSAAYLASTIEAITAAGVNVIFSEGQLSDRSARVVAESAGVGLVVLDPLGGAPGPDDYFELLAWNAGRIADALKGD